MHFACPSGCYKGVEDHYFLRSNTPRRPGRRGEQQGKGYNLRKCPLCSSVTHPELSAILTVSRLSLIVYDREKSKKSFKKSFTRYCFLFLVRSFEKNPETESLS